MPHSTLALLFRARIARPSALTLAAALVACNLGLTSSDEDSWSADDEITAQEIKRDLTAQISKQLRRMPILRFYLDDTLDHVFKMEEIFKQINEDKVQGTGEDSADKKDNE